MLGLLYFLAQAGQTANLSFGQSRAQDTAGVSEVVLEKGQDVGIAFGQDRGFRLGDLFAGLKEPVEQLTFFKDR